MSLNVKLHPSGVIFTSDGTSTILESALENNINIEYSCKDGTCGSCKAMLISGEVDSAENTFLTESDIAKGAILTCCSKATTDIELDVNYYPELSHIQKKTYPCKLDKIEFIGEGIAIISLRLPPTAGMQYLAGQYIDLIINGQRRSYSIANAPGDNIELHIRKVSNGVFSNVIFNELKLQQLLRIEGPQGTFFVREDTKPIIFLAGGTGFAPVKSMVEELIKNNDQREIHIYWGMPAGHDFYSDVAKEWSINHSNIHYVPVVSGHDDSWNGVTGFAHQAVINDISDLSSFNVYACGSLAMISAARNDFIKYGLDENNFFSDAFVPSK
ncbi:CDP-6-deoxy-delta-3,4-glucoseen reductase [Yersinia ruckeri]|uniref:CDP-6-deoxy-delta-3,4-glucoseen reductase n=1 Tax=Yersinia ruckeri TaxID=29486 RepID=UPI001F3DDFCA|nr:CDP-6-deoxy-delta-3,4-glucoseen reductase [Yersinia ruckeri]MCW6547011.1 CDP-6-deoxy-delta-3,4-glucoseen reductase [Yersinia ruckeri]MCW6572109.1 CDP-6-deoxy-delta-3,4-glucoseen reductase [Yersinia ruckeri]UIN01622.1 CDP-6-deoxy-delta-3,4-glucoseen reductase [Yersinia ruckeri]UZX54520.1 CDP-6-deoxy-delta-3,4-glucoseen reductase [Yersinia ruckeri]